METISSGAIELNVSARDIRCRTFLAIARFCFPVAAPVETRRRTLWFFLLASRFGATGEPHER